MISNLFDRRSAKKDVTSGLTLAVESVPDGMAVGTLAALNPVTGVYAYMIGGFSGAFFTSSVSMSIQATSAMALIVAGVPEVSPSADTAQDALFILTVLIGCFMAVLGLLKLGSVLRFVPDSVMAAFTQAVGLSIILGQLGNLTGYSSEGGNKIAQTINLLANLDQVVLTALATGVVAMAVMIAMNRTRFATMGILLAMFVGSLLPAIFDWSDVALVRDIGDIPRQLPLPIFPDLASFGDLVPALIGPAIALAIVGLVQGAAVTHAFPNPDGSKSDPSGDFTGQGLANVTTGFFQGMPVGGSFSATAILAAGGARTRFANIVAGAGIAVVLLVFSGAMELLAMPALAGFLLVLGVGVLKPAQVIATWRLGGLDRWGMVLLIAVALLSSLQSAVFVGVALSILLYVARESKGVTVRTAVYEDGQLVSEHDVEPTLGSESVVTLNTYGSLFFASAQLFEDQLPHPDDETLPTVVILDLRGHQTLDETTLNMLTDYADTLHKHQCRLMLAEVEADARETLVHTGTLDKLGGDNVFAATERVRQSVVDAQAAAEQWLATQR
jgi:SulP family sulfate permease